ncbi:MAG: hypothetical protein ACOYBE_13155 [Blautia sp.]|jgi:hypothetical protein
MTQATQVLSKTAENTGKSLEKALYVKSSVQTATNDLNTLTSQIFTAGDAGAILSNRLNTLILTGGVSLPSQKYNPLFLK